MFTPYLFMEVELGDGKDIDRLARMVRIGCTTAILCASTTVNQGHSPLLAAAIIVQNVTGTYSTV